MVFEVDGMVKYSEVDFKGDMKIDSMIDNFQDTTMLNSLKVGASAENLRKRGYAWVLSFWKVKIIRTPKIYDEIKIGTNPYDFKGLFGRRSFWIEDGGEKVVVADSVWAFMDISTLRPAKVLEDEIEAYGVRDAIAPDIFAESRKIILPDADYTRLPEIPVTRDMLDMNVHVNNCQYMRIALRAADLKVLPKEASMEFKKAAHFGDTFVPYVCADDKQVFVDLRSPEGVSYAVAQFVF